MLVTALAQVFRWRRIIEAGRYGTIDEMAAAETIERGYLGSLLRLTLLAPGLMEAILNGRAPRTMKLPPLLNIFPVKWSAQATVASSPDP